MSDKASGEHAKNDSPETEASLLTLDTLIPRFLPFSARLLALPPLPDAFANSASPMPKLLDWLLGPLERRLLLAAHDMLYFAVEFEFDEPENVALRVMFGLDAVRVTRLEGDADVLVLALFGVAERKVGI